MQNSEICNVCNYKISYKHWLGIVHSNAPTFYKFCPKCGTENNFHVETQSYGSSFKWNYEQTVLILLYLSISYGKIEPLSLSSIFSFFDWFYAIIIWPITIHYIFFDTTKQCHCCFNIPSKKSHNFCHNCGTEYIKPVIFSKLKRCLSNVYHHIVILVEKFKTMI